MNVQTIDFTADDAPSCLGQSLSETGFAVLHNHPIGANQIKEAYEAWADFFSSEGKNDWLFDPENQDGYFPFRSEHAKGASAKDLKEFYHVYSWGRLPPEIKALTEKLYQDLERLGGVLLEWLDDALPSSIKEEMTASLSDMMRGSEQSLLRILHYPPLGEDADANAVRAAAHEDINLITLLLAGSAPGLEAMDRNGVWHGVSCDTGMITINSGDMLSLTTSEYYPSTKHRVVNPDVSGDGNISRYSMPMFLHPRPDAALTPGFTAGMFLEERLKEIGLK